MATTYYHTVNGQITGQTKDGVRTHFLTDALGSVTTTLSDAGVVENTYRYKPYGGLLAKTGTAADPRFTWVGGLGYRNRSSSAGLFYVRARSYFSEIAQWSSQDLLWPDAHAYAYASALPVMLTDPTGLVPCPPWVYFAIGFSCADFCPEFTSQACDFCEDAHCECRAIVDKCLVRIHGNLTANAFGWPVSCVYDTTVGPCYCDKTLKRECKLPATCEPKAKTCRDDSATMRQTGLTKLHLMGAVTLRYDVVARARLRTFILKQCVSPATCEVNNEIR